MEANRAALAATRNQESRTLAVRIGRSSWYSDGAAQKRSLPLDDFKADIKEGILGIDDLYRVAQHRRTIGTHERAPAHPDQEPIPEDR